MTPNSDTNDNPVDLADASMDEGEAEPKVVAEAGGEVKGAAIAVVESKKKEDGIDDNGNCGDKPIEAFVSGKKRKLDDEDVKVNNELAKCAETETADTQAMALASTSSTTTMAAAVETAITTTTSAVVPTGNISIASVASAAQLSATMGWNGLGSILNNSLLNLTTLNTTTNNNNNSSSSSSGGVNSNNVTLPAKEQVLQAANKAVNDSPPFVHLSKTDSAPQLKITNSEYAAFKTTTTTSSNIANDVDADITVNDHLACKQGEGEMRGYRMARASHGVSSAGSYYYEVIIQKPPTTKELLNSLPSNVRLGPKLQREMQEALEAEEILESKTRKENDGKMENIDKLETKKIDDHEKLTTVSGFGSHVRLGWSMRTGDLQAPVGYDKWSYGVRSIGGSKIHCSRREDSWGGESFGPGDVIGCGISMLSDVDEKRNEKESSDAGTTIGQEQQQQQPRRKENHIRFFKNAMPMGQHIISKGKREGGAAFFVPDGVYYPAISLYMGATVKLNFGPNFVCPPRKLTRGLKFVPMSDLCKPPLSAEESSTKVTKDRTFRKTDTQQKFLELVETESSVLADAYHNHRKKHVIDIWKERKKRKLKTEDLENDKYFPADREALTRMM